MTDRQMTQCTKGMTDNTVGQKRAWLCWGEKRKYSVYFWTSLQLNNPVFYIIGIIIPSLLHFLHPPSFFPSFLFNETNVCVRVCVLFKNVVD